MKTPGKTQMYVDKPKEFRGLCQYVHRTPNKTTYTERDYQFAEAECFPEL